MVDYSRLFLFQMRRQANRHSIAALLLSYSCNQTQCQAALFLSFASPLWYYGCLISLIKW